MGGKEKQQQGEIWAVRWEICARKICACRCQTFQMNVLLFILVFVNACLPFSYSHIENTPELPSNRTYVLLVSSPRSGTNWLESLLSTHTDVLMDSEMIIQYLHSGDTGAARFDGPEHLERWRRVVIAQTRELAEREPHRRVVMWTLMYRHGLSQFGARAVDVLASLGFRIVHLKRRNKLRKRISNLLMTHEGNNEHASTDEQLRKIQEQPKVTLRTRPLLGRLRVYQDEEDVVSCALESNTLDYAVFTLFYEDMIGNTDNVLRGIQAFLGLEQRSLSSNQRMLHSHLDSPLKWVNNADEVKEALRGTPFEWMLHY